jgi:hypothetical protein
MTNPSTYIEGHGVFKAYGFQPSSSYPAWQAFDDTTNVWYSNGLSEYSGTGDYSGSTQLAAETSKGAYVVLEMPYEIVIKQTAFTQQINGSHVWDRGVYYAKCNPSDEWTMIHNVTDKPANDTTPYVAYITDPRPYKYFAIVITRRYTAHASSGVSIQNFKIFGTPGPTTLDKGSLTLGRSLDVPRVSRYDVDTETPRPEKLLVDFDTTVNSSPTDISGKGNHGAFVGGASYSAPDKAFKFSLNAHYIQAELNNSETGNQYHSVSLWFKITSGQSSNWRNIFECGENPRSGTSDISLYIPAGQDTLSFSNGGSHMYSDTLTNLYFQWHHVVITYDGANRKMYLDGALIKTLATTSWAGVANMTLRIGRTNANSEGIQNGLISNFKLYWQTALEPSEVQKLYRLGRTGRSMVISDTAVGIGKAPEAQLDVRGNLKISGVISSNSPGWSYWRYSSADINDAIYNSSTDGPVGGFSTLSSFGQNWETGISGAIADRGTSHNFNPTTGTYTAPEKGVYMVNFNFSIDGGSGGDDSMYIQFKTAGNSDGVGDWENGGAFINRSTSTNAFMLFNPQFTTRAGIEECWSINDIVLLDAGSTVNVRLENVSSSSTLTLLRCNFSGFKIA